MLNSFLFKTEKDMELTAVINRCNITFDCKYKNFTPVKKFIISYIYKIKAIFSVFFKPGVI